MVRLNKNVKENNDVVPGENEVKHAKSSKATKASKAPKALKAATTKTAKTAKTATSKTAASKTAASKTEASKTEASKTATSKTATSKTATSKNSVVVETKDGESSVTTLSDSFTELLGQLSALRSQLTTVTGNVRFLQKRSDKELKIALKSARKRRSNGPRAPSGFVKPTKISLELAKFLGKPLGTEMARTEVTREINGYIREHKLQDPINGRKILADDKLRKLLRLEKTDELTYFNLQKFMSPHFEKKSANVVVVPATN